MDGAENDERFAHIRNDPRFRSIPKRERKVRIDKRFQSMFHDKRFKLQYSMDKRGRPLQHSTSEDLKKYYELDSSASETEEKVEQSNIPVDDKGSDQEHKPKESSSFEIKPRAPKKNLKGKTSELNKKSLEPESDDSSESDEPATVDFCRGEGNIETSSSEDSSDEDENDSGFDHGWEELDNGVTKGEETYRRLALCNMDWDRIKVQDLFVLFNNFKPPQGTIHSLKIYPSEYGLQRMKEEEMKGPPELTQRTLGPDEEDMAETREGSKYVMETLRQYQLNRLKYYYAVVECDSSETAAALYAELDGMEYESSAARMDLRFIPDHVFFELEPSSVANALPDMTKYEPVLFTTKALQQTMVELTWDETDPDRVRTLERAFHEEEEGAAGDLKAYLASSSSEDDQDIDEQEPVSEVKGQGKSQIAKYKELLASLDEKNAKKEDDDVEMEITWEPGLKEKTENLIRIKQQKEEMTCFEKYLENKKDKKQLKRDRKLSSKVVDNAAKQTLSEDDDVPSDVDLNDPYFQEELSSFVGQKQKKKLKRKKGIPEPVEDDNAKAELELLLMEEDRNHFNLKDLMEDVTVSKRKKRKMDRMRKEELKEKKADNFQINMEDPRFSALFSSADFNIDPSDTHFRKTKAMETLVHEKQNRRSKVIPEAKLDPKPEHLQKVKMDPALSVLVKSVKNKTQQFKKKR